MAEFVRGECTCTTLLNGHHNGCPYIVGVKEPEPATIGGTVVWSKAIPMSWTTVVKSAQSSNVQPFTWGTAKKTEYLVRRGPDYIWLDGQDLHPGEIPLSTREV